MEITRQLTLTTNDPKLQDAIAKILDKHPEYECIVTVKVNHKPQTLNESYIFPA